MKKADNKYLSTLGLPYYDFRMEPGVFFGEAQEVLSRVEKYYGGSARGSARCIF